MRRRALMGGATPDKYANYMTIRALENGLVVSIDTTYSEPFYYCIHSEGEWKTLNHLSSTPSVDAGDAISFKSNREPNASEGIGTFVITKEVALEGNCMSLLYGDDVEGKPMKLYGFYRLFRYNDKIRYVSKDFLPATVLAAQCYRHMFSNCTGLTNAPKLPSMNMESYCYNAMFQGCTSLIDAPELPATTLKSDCYMSMFYGCSSLVNAPALPAETLAIYCYSSMFYGCSSLVNAPALPAETLAISCYHSMFYMCSSLKKAPVLPATKLITQCYNRMFYGCKKLNYIKAMFTTTPSTTYTTSWVYGVASAGVFVKSKDATWDVTGESGVPEGWTIKTE